MNISIFSSEEFSPLLKIMLFSLCESNNFEKHNIFVITTDMTEETEKAINYDLYRKFGQQIKRVIIGAGAENGFIDGPGYSAASYHKLYAFRKLPRGLHRLLCLDADMIIRGSLKNFYYQDMGEKILCAAKDFHILAEEKESIGLGKDDDYVNLGCLLIDLDRFLNKYTVEDYIEWANKWKPKYVAQDVVNALFKNKIKIVNEKYNYQVFSCRKLKVDDPEYVKYKDMSREQRKYIEDQVVILHYVGRIKPNNFRFISKTAKYFYTVMARNGMKKDLVKLMSLNLLVRVKKFIIGERVI